MLFFFFSKTFWYDGSIQSKEQRKKRVVFCCVWGLCFFFWAASVRVINQWFCGPRGLLERPCYTDQLPRVWPGALFYRTHTHTHHFADRTLYFLGSKRDPECGGGFFTLCKYFYFFRWNSFDRMVVNVVITTSLTLSCYVYNCNVLHCWLPCYVNFII